MHIQVVNFHLNDLSDADFRGLCDEVAPAFAEVPGLISKVWLANSQHEYLRRRLHLGEPRRRWRSTRKSDLFRAVAANPQLRGHHVDRLRRARGPDERDARARGAVPTRDNRHLESSAGGAE